MNLELLEKSIFHDGTSEYRIPMVPKEGKTVKVLLRGPKDDIKKALLLANGETIEMKKCNDNAEKNKTGLFDYFEGMLFVCETAAVKEKLNHQLKQ